MFRKKNHACFVCFGETEYCQNSAERRYHEHRPLKKLLKKLSKSDVSDANQKR